MNNRNILLTGKIFFALAVLSIGIVHIVSNNFPAGLLPVPAGVPFRDILVYVDGYALLIAGMMLLTRKYEFMGACFAAIIWLIWLLALHVPQLILTYKKAAEWTPTAEVAALLAGSLLFMGISDPSLNARFRLINTGKCIFAATLLVFFILHMLYAQYISTLITSWIPFKLFFAYLAGAAFLAVAISIFTRLMLRLSTLVLGIMFLIWVLVLHLPLVFANPHIEPQWTSLFVALGFSGISFMVSATANDRTVTRPL